MALIRIYAALLTVFMAMGQGSALAADAQKHKQETPKTNITGQVQAVQQTQPAPAQTTAGTLSAADILEIHVQPGQAKHKVQEYTITLNNKQARNVQVMQMEVLNGMTAEAYAKLKEEKSQANRRMASNMLRGVSNVAYNVAPYDNSAASQALTAGSHVAAATADVIENSEGKQEYTGGILKQASNIVISPQQKFQYMAAVPQSQPPLVKVVFKDLQTNQIYDMQK